MRITGVAAWLAVAIMPVVSTGQLPRTARCDSIQYRFVDEGAPTTTRRHPSVQDGESYALRDSTVVDGQGIAPIQVTSHRAGADTSWDVIAQLTSAGAAAMTAATGRNVGHTMVALWGDTILEHGIIESPLRSRVPVRLGVTRREADSLAARVRRVIGTSCKDP